MPRRLLPVAALATAASLVVLVGCAHDTPATSGSGPESAAAVSVSVSDCGSSWRPSAAGPQTLTLRNTDARPGEVQVVGLGAHRGLVYADVEPFGAGTTVRLDVPLAAGRYALACLMEDEPPITGPARTLTGDGPGAPGVRVVTQSDLVGATLRYTRWVQRHLPPLVRDTRRLQGRVVRGDLAGARHAWLAAHLDYQRLGAAYEAFGDLGDRIDGLPDGLRGGTANPHWAGFHRVEHDLFDAGGRNRLAGDVRALTRAASQLPRLVRSTQLDPTTLTLRAHEIAENALQFQLTGRDDFGSHTDLASVRAELVGTRAVLAALRGPIARNVDEPGRIRGSLRDTLRVVTAAARRHPHVPIDGLPREVRAQVSAAVSLVCERLAPVAASLEPRLTAGTTGGDSS